MIKSLIINCLFQGVNITGFIMATELFPPKQRTVAAVSHEFFWAIGGAFLPIFAYFLRSWRPLQICVSVPGALVLVLIWYSELFIFKTVTLFKGAYRSP